MKQFLLACMICLVPGLTYTIRPCTNRPCPPQYQRLHKIFGITQPCDDLWQISKYVARHHQLKPQQVMLALVSANPKAFYKRNINGLRTGYYLHIPPVHKMRVVSKREAYQEVRKQNRAWQFISADLAEHPTRHYLKLRKLSCHHNHHKKTVHRLHVSVPVKTPAAPYQPSIKKQQTSPPVVIIKNGTQALKDKIEHLKQENLILNDQVNNLLLQRKRWQMINYQQMKKIAELEAEIARLTQGVKSSTPTLSQVTKELVNSAILDTGNLKISRFSFHVPFTNRIVEFKNFQPLFLLLLVFVIVVMFVWLIRKGRAQDRTKCHTKGKVDSTSGLVKQVEKEMAALVAEDEPAEIKTVEKKFETDKEVKQDSYDYLSGEDVVTSKLDLAHAYLEMDEHQKARELLNSVVEEGNEKQQSEAKKLLKNIQSP